MRNGKKGNAEKEKKKVGVTKRSLYKRLLDDLLLHINYIRFLEMKRPFNPRHELRELAQVLMVLTNDFSEHLNKQARAVEKQWK